MKPGFPLLPITIGFITSLAIAASCGCDAGPAPAVTKWEPTTLEPKSPGLNRETISTPAGEVRYSLVIPQGYSGEQKVPLVLLLHYGYDGAKPEAWTGEGMYDCFEPGLRKLAPIVVAPDVVGGDWTSADNEQIAVWLTESIMATYAVDPEQVIVAGYSMGGAGTWHIAARHQDLFTAAIPVAAPVPKTAATEWTIPIYVVHSPSDEVIPYQTAKRHADALKANGCVIQWADAGQLTHFAAPAYGTFVGDGIEWIRSQ